MLDGMGSSGHVVGRLPVRILETSLSLRGMKEGKDELLTVAPLGEGNSHLEWFPNSLVGVPRGAEHLLAALPSLCSPTDPRPSQLGLVWVIVEARSSDAALHQDR